MLGVRPDERHGRAGGPAAQELALGDVRRVPDLLGKQMPVAREALERGEQLLRGGAIAGRRSS